MSKKRHPNQCTTCEKIPCQCAGGGGPDEEKSKKDNEVNIDSKSNDSDVNREDRGSPLTLFDHKNQLLYWTLFYSAANQSSPSQSHDLQEENTSNATNTSLTMSMKMGGVDE